MRTRRIAIAAVLWLTVLPGTALAHRTANREETLALVYDASGRYYGAGRVSEPRSVPLRCFVADISTVVLGSRWGAWTFSRYADQPNHIKQCRTGDGVVIEHKLGTRWYVLWEGSDGYPPTHDTPSGAFTLKGVPRTVAKDLIAGLY